MLANALNIKLKLKNYSNINKLYFKVEINYSFSFHYLVNLKFSLDIKKKIFFLKAKLFYSFGMLGMSYRFQTLRDD